MNRGNFAWLDKSPIDKIILEQWETRCFRYKIRNKARSTVLGYLWMQYTKKRKLKKDDWERRKLPLLQATQLPMQKIPKKEQQTSLSSSAPAFAHTPISCFSMYLLIKIHPVSAFIFSMGQITVELSLWCNEVSIPSKNLECCPGSYSWGFSPPQREKSV